MTCGIGGKLLRTTFVRLRFPGQEVGNAANHATENESVDADTLKELLHLRPRLLGKPSAFLGRSRELELVADHARDRCDVALHRCDGFPGCPVFSIAPSAVRCGFRIKAASTVNRINCPVRFAD